MYILIVPAPDGLGDSLREAKVESQGGEPRRGAKEESQEESQVQLNLVIAEIRPAGLYECSQAIFTARLRSNIIFRPQSAMLEGANKGCRKPQTC
jgi:hypothetical protein